MSEKFKSEKKIILNFYDNPYFAHDNRHYHQCNPHFGYDNQHIGPYHLFYHHDNLYFTHDHRHYHQYNPHLGHDNPHMIHDD